MNLTTEISMARNVRPWIRSQQDVARRFLTAQEVARYCSVPEPEVLSWIDSGMLKASYVSAGRYRVTTEDFIVFLQKYDIAI